MPDAPTKTLIKEITEIIESIEFDNKNNEMRVAIDELDNKVSNE